MVTNSNIPSESVKADLSLADRVRICIHRQGYPQLQAVGCESEGDSVMLSGQIESFYMKQLAQEVATRTPGVRKVRNDIQVI